MLLTFVLEASGMLAQGITPRFHVNSQMVWVPVTVTDRNGKTVEGLRAEDFSVFDNGLVQKLGFFGSDDAPCSIGIVLDISGSMKKMLEPEKSILHAFFLAANPQDEFLLLTVSTEPSSTSRFTTDIPQLEKSIGPTRSEGMTALTDTIYLGLRRMREAHSNRRALLVLSDGFDNHSRYSQGELMSMALEADVQVYTMLFDTGLPNAERVPFRPGLASKPWDQAREQQGPAMLEKLADKTGGLHFHVQNYDEAKDAILRTSQALRTEYLMGYRASDNSAPGKWHQIRVKVRMPSVSVHARNGYYSGQQQIEVEKKPRS